MHKPHRALGIAAILLALAVAPSLADHFTEPTLTETGWDVSKSTPEARFTVDWPGEPDNINPEPDYVFLCPPGNYTGPSGTYGDPYWRMDCNQYSALNVYEWSQHGTDGRPFHLSYSTSEAEYQSTTFCRAGYLITSPPDEAGTGHSNRGTPGQEICWTGAPASCTTPGAVTDLTADLIDAAMTRLAWLPPTDTGGCPLRGYTLTADGNHLADWNDPEFTWTNSHAYTEACVAARNTEATGPATCVSLPEYGYVGAPANLTATRNNGVHLQWEPAGIIGYTLDGYFIECSPACGYHETQGTEYTVPLSAFQYATQVHWFYVTTNATANGTHAHSNPASTYAQPLDPQPPGGGGLLDSQVSWWVWLIVAASGIALAYLGRNHPAFVAVGVAVVLIGVSAWMWPGFVEDFL